MWPAGLFAFWVCLFSRLTGVKGQAIVFDIFRNSSAVGPNDICASLTCYISEDNQEAFDIQQVISLVITETESHQSVAKHIAGLSFFNTEMHVYGDPATVSGTGKRSLKGGELYIYMKGVVHSCQSSTFSCELRFIDSQNKGHVVKVDKVVNVAKEVVKEPEMSPLDANVFKELKVLISDELSGLSEQSESFISNVMSAVKSVEQRLLRLEGLIVGDLNSRLDAIAKTLTKFDMILNEDIKPKLMSLDERVNNSIESTKSYINDTFDAIQNQIALLNEYVGDRTSIKDNLANKSFLHYLPPAVHCEGLQTNLSSTFQNHLSTFTKEIMEKLSAVDNRLESSSSQVATRIMMEAIVRMAHNISSTDRKLNELKTELGAEMQTVRLNISSLSDNMANKHDRFSREVHNDINNLYQIMAKKFIELTAQKQSLATLDKDIKVKILNIEVNLKDINVVIRNIKYIFGL